MKNHLKFLIFILFLGLLYACDKPKVYKIGVSQCSSDDWRSKMNEEIHREMLFHDDAIVEIRSADDSNEKQISDIRYFIDNDFDIIIAAPNEALAITPIIHEAYERGIPVITFDRDINDECYTAHLEVDNEALGYAAAQHSLALLSSPVQIIEIQGDTAMTPTKKRHDGFLEGLKGSKGITLCASVIGNWNDSIAAALTDSLLNLYPNVDIIYAHNDRMAIAASKTARARGFNHIKFIGIDGSPEIGIKAVSDGVIDATFLYPTDGHLLVQTAMSILKGQPYERIETLQPLSAVTKDNADILLRQDELLKYETKRIAILNEQLNNFLSKHTAQTSFLYFFIIIAVLLFGVIFLLLRAFWISRRHQKELEAATQAKLMFFTNVSHDLRTPLTLIGEPIDEIISHPEMDKNRRRQLLTIADRNIKILKRLVNQILDLRKYEHDKLHLNLTEVPIQSLIRVWMESFSTYAKNNNIALDLDISDDNEHIAVDVEKIERIIFNLLANALKFTLPGGRVTFKSYFHGENFVFSVSDNGKGIDAEKIKKIFEKFYQVENINHNGSGLGLTLSKAFAEMHGGDIRAESKVGEGSTFTVTIPIKHVSENIQIDSADFSFGDIIPSADEEITLPSPESEDEQSRKPVLLVVDDNSDILNIINGVLADEFTVISARNGKQGLKLATKYVPDIIISDVMMPIMDGLELCRNLKSELSTSHIPVLMLTACSMDEQRLEGYLSGADSYISKPFSGNLLKARVYNLLENRQRIRNIYEDALPADVPQAKQTPVPDKTDDPTAKENDFYKEFLNYVNQRIGDASLNIESLAENMGLSQSQFTRKIKSLTGHTPVEIIRNLRVKFARSLLLTTDKTISEIAYEAGFSSPAYFSKCYKDFYNESPSDIRSRIDR